MDPPVKLWEKWYYTDWDVAHFRDIELNQYNEYFITCLVYDYTYPIHENYVALLLDQDGDTVWEVPHEFNAATGVDGLALSDGSYIITGSAVDSTGTCTQGLLLHKISSDGTTIWARIYDFPETTETGYGITCLPDGGFAVCGRVHGTGVQAGRAWILRTDSIGDTLWTREWGTPLLDTSVHYGQSILYENNELCILAKGTDDSLITNGPHLLFYDLEGNYIRGTDYPELYLEYPADMCSASDGGYTFVTKTNCVIWHTDQYGETLWWHDIYISPNDQHEAFCIRPTMDGGYVFSGWDGYFEGPWDDRRSDGNTTDYKEGWLVRFDADGNELWNFNNTVSHEDFFYSCVQLPQGGYITGGTWTGTGYLVRYAPETGIEGGDVIQGITLEAIPNPFSGSLSVSFTLSELVHVNLEVFDLSGRLVQRLLSEEAVPGLHSVEWSPGASVSSGCYLLRLVCAEETVSRRCVLLR
jgi:hypothetical protein